MRRTLTVTKSIKFPCFTHSNSRNLCLRSKKQVSSVGSVSDLHEKRAIEFVNGGNLKAAVDCLFFKRTSATFNSYVQILRECATRRSLAEGRKTHFHMIRTGFPYLSLGNKIIDMYIKCGSIQDARHVFDEMPQRHIVAWNFMISAYIRCGQSEEALQLYKNMLPEGVLPDEFTFASIFKAFSDLGLLLEGKTAHGCLIISGLDATNVFIGSAVVDLYAKFGELGDARLVFDRMPKRDVVLCTALIVGYSQNEEDQEALEIFTRMVREEIKPNDFSFASVLIACGNLAELDKGKQIHGITIKAGFETSISSQTSLLTMYSKCGLTEDSLSVFDRISDPNLVTWTAMIAGLVQNSQEEMALSIFCKMISNSIKPNQFTLSTALRACSSLALLDQGKQIHAHILKTGFDRNKFAGAALVDMYGKCGSIEMARLVFDNVEEFDVVSMNSIISGYSQNGYGHEAIELFDQMKRSGLPPNSATFVSILSACSNSGMLEQGYRIFGLMIKDPDIEISTDHYSCMVDLLGRAGKLEEAERLIMAVKEPDIVLWRTLLGACRIHGRIEIGKRAAENLLKLEPGDDGTYVLLSNIYASAGNWSEVVKIKTAMKEIGLKKEPALSWIEIDRKVHTFAAGDQSHPRSVEIYEELERLIVKMKSLGYVPDTSFVLQDLEEMERERSLYSHSEKLAIVFGLLSTPVGMPIRIFKNLRVCGDCHTGIKFICKIVGREIIARDAKRFHHFKDGLCSCGDYW